MDPTILIAIIAAAVGFAIRHFLPSPTPNPVPPNTFGHGELIRYILQLIANFAAQNPIPIPTPAPPPVGPGPNIDWNAFLAQILTLLEKALNQAPPAPKP